MTDDGKTALHYAATLDDVVAADLLISKGANIELRDDQDFTALHHAAATGATEVSELLLQRGANLEPLGIDGQTPLMVACSYAQLQSVKLLLDQEDPNLTLDMLGQNLLALTIKGPDNPISRSVIWDLLLRRGINLYQSGNDGMTPAHFMLCTPQQTYLKAFLRLHTNTLKLREIEWSWSQLAHTMIPRKDRFDCITRNYRLLHRYLGQEQPLRLPDSVTTGETSLFYLAASEGYTTAIENFFAVGFSLELECCQAGTALMIASAHGQLEAVKYLVRRKARLFYESPEDGHHKSAFAAAAALGHDEVLRWLLVERHVEQPKIAHAVLDPSEQTGVQTGKWSGIQQVRLPLKWEWRQRRFESMFEYALRRQEIISEFRGEVVEQVDEFDV
ncbi:hypothetical protein SLS62_006080 [Diatrype stigma]|uniref:Uncharacterized protein n=1 Tax=Diatrype stigma TaxID=117547 RepID=A0AAN9YRJ9_9PEZI